MTKFVFPILWIGGFAFGTLVMFVGPEPSSSRAGKPPAEEKWIFLTVTLAGSLFLYWTCMRLKRVRLEGSQLLISSYFEEISVPLSQLESVTENRWINIRPVTLTFRAETAFGRSVVFMPKVLWFRPFSQHPVVTELRELAKMEATS